MLGRNGWRLTRVEHLGDDQYQSYSGPSGPSAKFYFETVDGGNGSGCEHGWSWTT